MTEDEFRNTPAYRQWEVENARRSAAMADAVRDVQGSTQDEQEDEESEPFE